MSVAHVLLCRAVAVPADARVIAASARADRWPSPDAADVVAYCAGQSEPPDLGALYAMFPRAAGLIGEAVDLALDDADYGDLGPILAAFNRGEGSEEPDEPLPGPVCLWDAPPPEPVRWLVRDFWPAGELGLMVGDGGAFKSSAALHVAAAIAGGYDVFDYYPTERRPVLIVSAEDQRDVIHMRVEAFIAGHGWGREAVLRNFHVFADREPSLGDASWKRHIVEHVERIRPGFIVYDPWAELYEGDENSNTEARPVIKFIRRLARSVDAAACVVHHAGKAGQDKRTVDRIRGATRLVHASRVTFFFDYRDDGVAVENLKMSRAQRLPNFVIRREIAHAADNRAHWTSARLAVQDARAYTAGKAEEWVIAQLRLATNPLTSTDLRTLAKGTHVRNEDLAKAVTRLNAVNIIAYDPGPQGSRFWRIVTPASGGPALTPYPGNGTAAGSGTSNGSALRLHQGNDADDATDDAGETLPTLPRGAGQPSTKVAHLAQRLPTGVGQARGALAPPFRGGAVPPATTPPPWAGSDQDDDDRATDDERAGLGEGW